MARKTLQRMERAADLCISGICPVCQLFSAGHKDGIRITAVRAGTAQARQHDAEQSGFGSRGGAGSDRLRHAQVPVLPGAVDRICLRVPKQNATPHEKQTGRMGLFAFLKNESEAGNRLKNTAMA